MNPFYYERLIILLSLVRSQGVGVGELATALAKEGGGLEEAVYLKFIGGGCSASAPQVVRFGLVLRFWLWFWWRIRCW